MKRLLITIFTMLLVGCSSYSPLGSTTTYSRKVTVLSDVVVDGLRVRHGVWEDEKCVSGGQERLEISGTINSDSTFLLERFLKKMKKCEEVDGTFYKPFVFLDSSGGTLKDGIAMGRLFREYGTQVVLSGGHVCASACAVAFLGSPGRSIWGDDARLIFHAPYLTSGIYGTDCSDRGQVAVLEQYVTEMIGATNSDYVMERMMSYCSRNEGWTLNKDGAEAFGLL